ncbi:MAG: PilZ domain-containing protein [Pseudomonadota bacterium]
MPIASRTPTPDQRRQHVRVPLRMSAEVHVGEVSFTAKTRDLSEGGCGLALRQSLAEDTEVTLGFFLVVDDVEDSATPPLWVKGRVAWSGEADDGGSIAGVRFEVITDQQKAWITQVLGHLTP